MEAALYSRYVACRVVDAVMIKHQPLDVALASLEDDSKLQGPDRGFARALAMLCLRRGGEIDAVIAAHVKEKLPPSLGMLQHILRIGVVQLAWLGTPPHAAIHTAVELAKQLKFIRQSGLVNAVLKNIAKSLPLADVPAYNIPAWLRESWKQAYGAADAQAMMLQLTAEPLLDIQVKEDAAGWAEKLQGNVVHGQVVRLANGRVEQLEGYDDGAWWVQDVAASLPALLLGDVNGKRVLDGCAAPGGKTVQLAMAGAHVVALDRNKKRLVRLHDNMKRLQLNAEVVCADALEWDAPELFDAVLLDAPCSATGTLRRHPDILYQKTQADVDAVLPLQRDMLARAAGWVKPGGALVYCVCSLQPEEGEQQVQAFLAAHADWQLEPVTSLPDMWVRGGMLRTLPHQMDGGMDGFFAARLVRR